MDEIEGVTEAMHRSKDTKMHSRLIAVRAVSWGAPQRMPRASSTQSSALSSCGCSGTGNGASAASATPRVRDAGRRRRRRAFQSSRTDCT